MASFCHKPRLTESRVQDPYNLSPPNPKGGRTAWGRGEQRHLPMKLGNFWTPFNIWLRRRQPSRTEQRLHFVPPWKLTRKRKGGKPNRKTDELNWTDSCDGWESCRNRDEESISSKILLVHSQDASSEKRSQRQMQGLSLVFCRMAIN